MDSQSVCMRKEDTCRAFPACFVELPASAEGKRAAFYLAAEEYVARVLPEGNYLFTWVLSPTVVMGRNQVAADEINLAFCRSEGIDVARRKSGGGCIYADTGNIMVSLITGAGAVEPLFAEYASCVAGGLRQLGAGVEVSGRNDIVLSDGGKICGNAFYHLPKRNIVHGTMLYDTDLRLMTGALTPDAGKLRSSGVKSVRSRIGLLKDKLDIGVEQLRAELRNILCDRTIRLDEDDIQYIKAMETDYYDPEYLFGKAESTHFACSRRIEGCGKVELHFALKNNIIEKVGVHGDFFEQKSASEAFTEAFSGVSLTYGGIKEAITTWHPEISIRGLDAESLVAMITEKISD